MDARALIDALTVAERLKDTMRHCYTKNGRRESVAEHCWLMTLAAFWMKDEFPEADMDRVLKMCLIHDLGEAFTGDVPAFEKTASNEQEEKRLLYGWVTSLPGGIAREMMSLYDEMEKRETLEAKIYKAVDGLEAVIQHNISDISTWLPLEYGLNLTYADDKVAFSEYLRALREEIRKDTLAKIDAAGRRNA